MHRRHPLLVFSVFVGVACIFHEPLRAGTLSVIRAPFRLASSLVEILLTLPRLPHLAEEHTALQAELTRRSLELAQTREALRQLTAAEELLTPSMPQAAVSGPAGLVASIIGRSPIPNQQTVLLNQGQQQGLERDTILVDASGVVGRLIEVHPTTSLAMLITDPNSRVAGLVERSRESGLLIGQGSGLCRFIYLEVEADVVEGDRVVTAGLGPASRPKGLWLGTVVSVLRDRDAGSATAMVRPAANLGRLEEVRCLVPAS